MAPELLDSDMSQRPTLYFESEYPFATTPIEPDVRAMVMFSDIRNADTRTVRCAVWRDDPPAW